MSLRNVILVVKDLAQTKAFFVDALRLKLKYENENIMEFDTGSVPLILKTTYTPSMIQTGYSPMLSFDVEDMDHTIQTALKLGAMMDGPIKYPAQGKFAALRSPDGHMIGLFEPSKL